MEEFTFDEMIVSDIHKEAYDLRPNESWWIKWNKSSDSEKQKIWNSLIEKSKLNAEK